MHCDAARIFPGTFLAHAMLLDISARARSAIVNPRRRRRRSDSLAHGLRVIAVCAARAVSKPRQPFDAALAFRSRELLDGHRSNAPCGLAPAMCAEDLSFGPQAVSVELASRPRRSRTTSGRRRADGKTARIISTHEPGFGPLIIRGEDSDEIVERGARDALIAEKSRILAGSWKRCCRMRTAISAYRWAGTFAPTRDGLPLDRSGAAKNASSRPMVMAATASWGWGRSFYLAAQLIVWLIAGRARRCSMISRLRGMGDQ